MNVIRSSSNEVMNFLGGSQKKVKGFNYRFNKFIIKTDFEDDQYIWYNTFTGAIVAIKDYEADNVFTDDFCQYADFLIQNYFLVPENFDEEGLLEEYRRRKVVPITANALTRLKHFTILTTTKCNARCFYCYQMHGKGKQHMTEETAHKVARYIIDSTFDGQNIFIGWFGGEPLFNYKIIDIITTKVGSANRKITSSIITNGYLFDEKLCKKAVRDWNMHNVQITLDGTEEVYNKAKNFIYKDEESPFKRVVGNIHHMLDAGLRVSVRMNVDLYNVENLKELIVFLAEEFKGEENFSAYIHELFDDTRTIEHDTQLFHNMMEVDKLLVEKNLRSPGFNVPETIKTTHCMVDDDRSIVIMPDGQLGLCEHYENEHYVSHIDTPTKIDMNEVRAWREMSEYTEICKDCPSKPTCVKCKLCPDHKICTPPEKEYVLNKTEGDLRIIYKEWIHNQEKRSNNSCSCR